MQNRSRPHFQQATSLLRGIDWRRWYAAAMVGLAAFLIGLILWPSKPLVRRTTAVIQVETKALAASRLSQLETELLAIQDELLSDDRLKMMIAEMAATNPAADNNIDVNAFRARLHVIPDELPGDDEDDSGAWWIRFVMNGTGSDVETRLVNRVATEFALEWQRRLVEVDQLHELRSVRSTMLDVLRRQRELAEKTEEVCLAQANTLSETLRQFAAPTNSSGKTETRSSNATDSSGVYDADARAFQLASSAPRELGSDPANFGSPDARRFGPDKNEVAASLVENPQWRSINNRLQLIRQQSAELRRVNPHWDNSHGELRRLDEEARFLAEQLTRVEPYIPRESVALDSNRLDTPNSTTELPRTLNGNTHVETNQFYRSPSHGTTALRPVHAEAQPVRFLQPGSEELASIQSEVMAPMEMLRALVTANQPMHDQAMQALNSIVLKGPNVRQVEAHVVQPATTYLLASTNGTWRIIFLMLTSLSGAVFFGTVFRTELDSRLSSSLEIEMQLGIPVVGRVGNSAPLREPTWMERLQPANTILRSSEAIVFALFALVFVTVLFNSRLAVDLAESPLLTISEILGSLFRRS